VPTAKYEDPELCDAPRGGRLGTGCVYQATDPEAIREHARRVGTPADAITPVVDTVIVRPDPTNL
jgi:hypothetical protein